MFTVILEHLANDMLYSTDFLLSEIPERREVVDVDYIDVTNEPTLKEIENGNPKQICEMPD